MTLFYYPHIVMYNVSYVRVCTKPLKKLSFKISKTTKAKLYALKDSIQQIDSHQSFLFVESHVKVMVLKASYFALITR